MAEGSSYNAVAVLAISAGITVVGDGFDSLFDLGTERSGDDGEEGVHYYS